MNREDIFNKIRTFLNSFNYDDLFPETMDKKREFNKMFFIETLELAEIKGYDVSLVTEAIIDKVWFYHCPKKINNKIKDPLDNLEFKDERIPTIVKRLQNILVIKDIDSFGRKIEIFQPEYKNTLNNTAELITLLTDKDIINDVMIDAHFKSLIAEKEKKLKKTINSVNANKVVRDNNKPKKNIMSELYYISFFIIFEFYLTKIKIMKIHIDIQPILNALDELKRAKTPYNLTLQDDTTENHYKFVNTFPKKDADLYLILVFSIYLKSSFKNTRDFVGLLLNKDLSGNFGVRNDKLLENKYLKLEELELIIEYIDNRD